MKIILECHPTNLKVFIIEILTHRCYFNFFYFVEVCKKYVLNYVATIKPKVLPPKGINFVFLKYYSAIIFAYRNAMWSSGSR